tara:strand:+ start:11468 stop:12133 length:666 start_codon:yes stop_codon:yes gene_type:complete
MNNKFLIIGQGSQTIQLLRELFSLNIRPENISILTVDDISNFSFLEYIKYYELEFILTNKLNFDKDLEFLLIKNFYLVISFSNPFIIKSKFLKKSTFINFHPGILPNYRGSFSTVHSMINGESEVGGTWHYVSEKVDKGNILLQTRIKIDLKSTAFSLNHSIFSKGINQLDNVISLVNEKHNSQKQNKSKGIFYHNKFPSLNKIKDEKLLERINYFPPKFK